MDSVALTGMEICLAFCHIIVSKKAGIKPIIGCEVYVAVESRFNKKPRSDGGWGNNHLILLAQSYKGYQNLMKISYGYLEGFYYRPRIDMELIEKYSEGLICLSGCLKGEIPERMLKGDWEGAKNKALEFSRIFENRFYFRGSNHWYSR